MSASEQDCACADIVFTYAQSCASVPNAANAADRAFGVRRRDAKCYSLTQMHGLTLLKSIAVAMLVLANAFFVAAEFGLVSIRETRIEQMLASKVPGARAVRLLQRRLDELLPAVQLGVTLCSLALGWIGEPLAASLLSPLFAGLPHARVYADIAAGVIGFGLITYFHVVVGELVPKSLALSRSEALSMAVAPPMLAFMALTKPAVRLLRGSAATLLRGFDVPLAERAVVHSSEELKLIASAAGRMGLLPKFQETLIQRALELDDVPTREIMTPRQKIFSLPSNMRLEEASAKVIARHRSRVPVYDEERGPEHIIGVVYARDLARLIFFRTASNREQNSLRDAAQVAGLAQPGARITTPFVELRLRQIMRDILVVPETKSVLNLVRDFQQRRRHMAVVVDEYGSVVGLVTAEDAIEQLTGELEDEFDSPAVPVLSTASGALLMDGGVNLRDLETQMQWNLPRDGGVETLAGFLLVRLAHLPAVGESTIFQGRRYTVVEMDGRRIAKIRVEPLLEGAVNTD
jgi:putative hemolysin